MIHEHYISPKKHKLVQQDNLIQTIHFFKQVRRSLSHAFWAVSQGWDFMFGIWNSEENLVQRG